MIGRKWIARGVGLLVFISMYVGLNIMVMITDLQVVVTGLISLFFAAYIADQIDPTVDTGDPSWLHKSQVSETPDVDPRTKSVDLETTEVDPREVNNDA